MPDAPLRLSDDARIIAWRSERAKLAEAAHQQRLAATAADRDERMARFEAEKEQRIEEARQKREAEQERAAVARRVTARARLAGLEDLTFAAAEISRDTRLRNRLALSRFTGLTLIPALLTTIALILFADPVYEAQLITIPGPEGAAADIRDLAGFRAEARIPLWAQQRQHLAPVAETADPLWLSVLRHALAPSAPVRADYDQRKGLLNITASSPQPDQVTEQLADALAGPEMLTIVATTPDPISVTASRLTELSMFIFASFIFVYGLFRIFVSSFVYYSRK